MLIQFKNGRSASPDLDDILESFAMADDDDEHNTAKVKTEAAEKTDSNEDNNDDNDVSKFLKIEMPDEHVAVKKEEKIVTDDLSLMCLFSCNLCEVYYWVEMNICAGCPMLFVLSANLSTSVLVFDFLGTTDRFKVDIGYWIVALFGLSILLSLNMSIYLFFYHLKCLAT